MKVVPILIGLFFFAVIGAIIFVIADSVGTVDQYGTGLIVDKTFSPAHTEVSTSYDTLCECMKTTTTHYDDEWTVQVNMDGTTGWIEVSYNRYNTLYSGEKAHITYYVGRFSNNIYFKNVELLE